MKSLDINTILDRADVLYASEKLKHLPASDIRYLAPEQLPRIQSDQVKALAAALVEALNQQTGN